MPSELTVHGGGLIHLFSPEHALNTPRRSDV
jgi:hypothetical protein